MTEQTKQLFEKTFKSQPSTVARAPGRLEILGNHTDYNEGYVLSTAVDSYTCIAFSKSETGRCQIFSPQVEGVIREFDFSEIDTPLPGKDWLNYIKGVVVELENAGHSISPFNAVISTSIPLSAGMSSSAALEMAMVTGLGKLFKFDLPLKEKALIGQSCENNYIGANTGLMDQFTSLGGRKNHLILSEYRNLTLKDIPFPEEISILVVNSGVSHDLSIEYNERREQCEKAAEILHGIYPGVKTLRDISLETFLKHKDKFPELVFRRALHVIGENNRVHQALKLLKQNRSAEFGQLLFESHQSSINNFENSCKELDYLVRLAGDSPLCIGSRLSGGGFGGISIHLIPDSAVDEYSDYVCKKFKNQFGTTPKTFTCRSADGAETIFSER